MQRSEANVTTAHASRYLQQLCKHWAHKFPVEFTPEAGRIELPAGVTRLEAKEGALRVEVTAEDEASIERLEKVVADHIVRFAFREELAFDWQRSN